MEGHGFCIQRFLDLTLTSAPQKLFFQSPFQPIDYVLKHAPLQMPPTRFFAACKEVRNPKKMRFPLPKFQNFKIDFFLKR